MKSLKSIILTVLTVAMSTLTAQAAISVGAEQTSEYIPLLKGKRVALLSNHTGMVGNEHVLDIMLRKGSTSQQSSLPNTASAAMPTPANT